MEHVLDDVKQFCPSIYLKKKYCMGFSSGLFTSNLAIAMNDKFTSICNPMECLIVLIRTTMKNMEIFDFCRQNQSEIFYSFVYKNRRSPCFHCNSYQIE